MLQVLQTDPNWPRQPQPFQGITRRFILGMALLSCALVLLGFPLVQVGMTIFMPSALEYRNLPFQVCSSASTRDVCVPLEATDTFRPGDVVPVLATRCVESASAGGMPLAYVLNRNLVNTDTGIRIILSDIAASVMDGGCQTALSFSNQLPESLAPGTYYFEGVAVVYGRFKTSNAYFRTQPFVVAKR